MIRLPRQVLALLRQIVNFGELTVFRRIDSQSCELLKSEGSNIWTETIHESVQISNTEFLRCVLIHDKRAPDGINKVSRSENWFDCCVVSRP